MKKTLLHTSAAVALILAYAGAAQAAESGTLVRDAQQRLQQMGYYAGPLDGVAGEKTQNAVLEFQARHGLETTGRLTPETYSMIGNEMQGVRYSAVYGTRGYGYGYAPNYQNVNWAPQAWNGPRAQILPTRFAQLAVNDDMSNGMHNYTVTLNGQSVLFANYQPDVMRVSSVYRLSGEDAVIFTTYDGASGCGYKNYLLTVKSNGTYTPAREIGNCAGNYEARVDGNMLYVNFPGQYAANGGFDAWRYGNNMLVRI